MKFGRKIGSGIAAAALCLSMAAGVSASSNSSVSAPGYGTLQGWLILGGDLGGSETSITENKDNAYVVAGYEIQDKNGKVVQGYHEDKSSRGRTSAGVGFVTAPLSSHVLFGTHGVQGGNTHGAKAVYTYTHFNR